MSFATHTLTNEEVARFSRQLILKGFGPSCQEKLRDASVLVIGAGGLGCPISIYLAAAGVGRIGIIDHDTVSLDNLHRQFLHDEDRVGDSKVESLKKSLLRLNNLSKVETYNALLNSSNALDLIRKYDIIADCSDNVSTRYLVNDSCILSGKPLVSGSALGWEGQITVYNCGSKCPCYRCIFPVPPSPENVSNCSDAGVLGPVVGVIGSLQALEVIKIITSGNSSLAGNLWLFDGFEARSRVISLREKLPGCGICGENPTITELQKDYGMDFCGAGPTDKIRTLSIVSSRSRVNVKEYEHLRRTLLENEVPSLLDVRPSNEFQICHLTEAKNIPLDQLKMMPIDEIMRELNCEFGVDRYGEAQQAERSTPMIYVVCHRGNESQLAVKMLEDKMAITPHLHLAIKDIVGGLDSWALEVDKSFPRY